MIIGKEFMRAAQEIQIDFVKRHIRVPIFHTQLSEGERPNLCGGLLSLYYTEAEVNGESLPLLFNLGTVKISSLSDKYFAKHKEWIEKHCTTDSLRSTGFLTEVQHEKGYLLKDVELSVNGILYTFPKIFVSANSGSVGHVYGNIGSEYFSQFSKVIFNTKDMFMKVVP